MAYNNSCAMRVAYLRQLYIHAPLHHSPPPIPSSLRAIMSTVASTSTSRPDFASIFDAALEIYKLKTKKDLASHPLLSSLSSQCCASAEAILSAFPAFDKIDAHLQDGSSRP